MNPADPYGLIGQVLDGQFRVDGFVGDGGLSVVYKARHMGLDEPVALKCLKLPPALNSSLVENFVQRFRDESRIQYRLSQGNLHICRSIASGTTMSPVTGALVPYMVLEWLDGRSLADELAERKRQGRGGRSPEDLVKLLDAGVEAIAYAHAQGVVHRDINPENLFLANTRDGVRLKVLDFGLAKIVGAPVELGPRAATIGQLRLFSPPYGAPEQFDERIGAVGPWTDVYALAMVALEVLLGRQAMAGEHIGEIAVKAVDPAVRPTPRTLGLMVGDEVEAAFARAVALSPSQRAQDAGEFWGGLKNALRKEKSAEPYPRGPAGTKPGSSTLAFGSQNIGLVGVPPNAPPGQTLQSAGTSSPRPPLTAPKSVSPPRPPSSVTPPSPPVAPAPPTTRGTPAIAPTAPAAPSPTFGKTLAMSSPAALNLPIPAPTPAPPPAAAPNRIGSGTMRLEDASQFLTEVAKAQGKDAANTAKIRVPADLLDSSKRDSHGMIIGRPTSVDPMPPTMPAEDIATPGTLAPAGFGAPPPPPDLNPFGATAFSPAPPDMSPFGATAFMRNEPDLQTTPGLGNPLASPGSPLATTAPSLQEPQARGLGDTLATAEAPEFPFQMPPPNEIQPQPFAAGFGPDQPMGPATQGLNIPAPPPNWSSASSSQEATLKKRRVQPIRPVLFAGLGAIAVLAIVGMGYGVYRVVGAKTAPTEEPAAAESATAARVEAPPTASAAAPPPEPTTPPPAETVAEPTPAAAQTAEPARNDRPTSAVTPEPARDTSARATDPTASSTAKAPKPPAPKTFNAAAAKSALDVMNGILASCKKKDGVTGPGRITVTFAPEGNVQSTTIDKAPYAGTPEATCIASRFKLAKMQPFEGPAGVLEYTFNVPK